MTKEQKKWIDSATYAKKALDRGDGVYWKCSVLDINGTK